jgi:hypothetical protein
MTLSRRLLVQTLSRKLSHCAAAVRVFLRKALLNFA